MINRLVREDNEIHRRCPIKRLESFFYSDKNLYNVTDLTKEF